MRQIVFDTETTGLRPEDGHRIVEIGCVELVNRSLTGKTLHFYLNPGRDSEEGALAVHGLTTEFLADKPRFADVADEFLAFIQGAELIAHNATFDVKFFNAEFKLIGRGEIAQYCESITDSLLHARAMFPGKRNSLDALCDRFGISNAHRTLHGALLDSELLAEVWLAMTRGQDALLIDTDDAAPGAGAGNSSLGAFDASVLPVIAAAADELAEHAAYLKALDKASGKTVWRAYEPLAAEGDAA
ncbi:MAG TPA: DNA polymerase III subunit epsilon [Bordetella sp.]